jgi:hypothetical protein
MGDDFYGFTIRTLTKHAEHLNAIRQPASSPEIFFELMSGALVWSDETNPTTPTEVVWALRVIFAYRTSLMLNQPRAGFKPVWDQGLALFPKRIGFLPERRQPTPNLLAIYRRGDVSLRKCLRDMERELDGENWGR